MQRSQSWLLSVAIVVGLVCTWIGERLVDSSTARIVWSVFGVLLVIGAAVVRWRRGKAATGEDGPRIEKALLSLNGLVVLALVFYFEQSDVWARVSGEALEVGWPKLAVVLSVMWPAVLVAGLLPTLLVEMSYAAMAASPRLEALRIREAMFSGLGLAFVLTFAFSTQYVMDERDAKADLSYFRTAKPGDATKHLVASLDAPVQVFLFYPPTSDSAERIKAYFDDLKHDAPMLTVERLDRDLEPKRASELGVSGNGTIVFEKGGRKETLYVAPELEKARSQLAGFDAEVQKKLLAVAKTKRTVYFTAGHGERTEDPLGGTDQRATTEMLRRQLKDQNFDVRTLSAAEGLANEVPKDAAAVFILGPQQPFTAPEAEAIKSYALAGGKLFVALDPEAAGSFPELMDPLGLTFAPQTLAHEKLYARVTNTVADRVNVGTRTFSSHPAVNYLSRYNAGLVTMGAGVLEEAKAHPADVVVDFIARADPDTWNDANNNFQFDQGETRKAYGLLAAVTKRGASGDIDTEMRVLVLADSDALGDVVLAQVRGNQLLVVDGLKWLLGEEKLQGATNSEQDVPLTRTRQQDTAWFYGTTFLAPVLVVGVGFFARRRTRKSGKAEVKS